MMIYPIGCQFFTVNSGATITKPGFPAPEQGGPMPTRAQYIEAATRDNNPAELPSLASALRRGMGRIAARDR